MFMKRVEEEQWVGVEEGLREAGPGVGEYSQQDHTLGFTRECRIKCEQSTELNHVGQNEWSLMVYDGLHQEGGLGEDKAGEGEGNTLHFKYN